MQTQSPSVPRETENSMNPTPQVLERLVQQRTAALRRLSARLLRVQEEERRHLARELHDSTGQTLTALKLELVNLQGHLQGHPAPESLAQAVSLADQALREIRTTSYLLYPPLLEETGLCSATRWYVDGFARRSNVQVTLNLASIGRLSRPVEIALFRVLQESLTNVYRHSASQTADVRLERAPGGVTLEVYDYGQGIPGHLLEKLKQEGNGAGVGLAGIRERIQELGGQFEIRSDGAGTVIRAAVPTTNESAARDEMTESMDAVALAERQRQRRSL
jgi:two-component system, NarL family, sensor kinase